MRVGLAAYEFRNGDLSFNLAQIERGLEAARGRAELLCFGEAFLQGFDALCWEHERDLTTAVTADGPELKALGEMTLRYGTDLLLGYIERQGEEIYSSCALISGGRILHNYRRISVGWKEWRRTDCHYREGTESVDLSYRGRTVRIALCGDLWDCPERFKTEGLLLWPVYVNFSPAEWEEYEGEYACQAALAARETLLVNSLTKAPEAVGGAFRFSGGEIWERLPYNTEDILFVEV